MAIRGTTELKLGSVIAGVTCLSGRYMFGWFSIQGYKLSLLIILGNERLNIEGRGLKKRDNL